MAFQPGQEVRVKNTQHIIGKIVRLRDSDPIEGDLYLVKIEPRTLVLKVSSLEAIDDSGADPKRPKPGTPEWIAEAQRAVSILQAALNNPEDPIARKAMVETLDKLGFLMPITSDEAATH
ncbi:MAG TPA: hypothetical protein VGG56_16290 [Terracidiphilus sp.]|jgi:hypothetical protein